MIEIFLSIIATYLVCGFLFAIPFIIKGIGKVDESARGSTIGFRIIIMPGVIVFWPFLLKKWIKVNSTSHDEAA